jgi:hypothetical protein
MFNETGKINMNGVWISSWKEMVIASEGMIPELGLRETTKVSQDLNHVTLK